MQRAMNICVTGACGAIAYSLYNSLCCGFIFGPDVIINLKLLDISSKMNELKILRMELEDCCYSNVEDIQVFDDTVEAEAFKDVDLAIFLGSQPRKPGMEKKEVFEINAAIFRGHGQHLNQFAKKTCKCLVISNPPNTNCMILCNNAPSIPRENFTCLTRLDYHRFLGCTARLFDCHVRQIKNAFVWGNHSRGQFCDLTKVQIEGFTQHQIKQKVAQLDYNEVERIMYDRGGFILEKSGNTYLSATKGIIDHLKDWFTGSDNTVSMGVVVNDEIYGIPKGLCYSLPVICLGGGSYNVVANLELNEYQKKRVEGGVEELLKEKSLVLEFMQE